MKHLMLRLLVIDKVHLIFNVFLIKLVKLAYGPLFTNTHLALSVQVVGRLVAELEMTIVLFIKQRHVEMYCFLDVVVNTKVMRVLGPLMVLAIITSVINL